MKLEEEGFFKFLNLKVMEVSRGYAKVLIDVTENLKRKGDILHGGAIFSTLDYAGTIAVHTLDNVIDQYTVEVKISFMKPVIGPKFIGIARVLEEGKRVIFVELEGYDNDRLCVKGIGTWYVVRKNEVYRQADKED